MHILLSTLILNDFICWSAHMSKACEKLTIFMHFICLIVFFYLYKFLQLFTQSRLKMFKQIK